MRTRRREAYDREVDAAEQLVNAGRATEAYAHLERAHVLGQEQVLPHVLAHWLMLRIEIQRRDVLAALGQMVRIILGAVGSAVGIVPRGNTGGSNVSMFKPMPIPPDLAILIEPDDKNRDYAAPRTFSANDR